MSNLQDSASNNERIEKSVINLTKKLEVLYGTPHCQDQFY